MYKKLLQRSVLAVALATTAFLGPVHGQRGFILEPVRPIEPLRPPKVGDPFSDVPLIGGTSPLEVYLPNPAAVRLALEGERFPNLPGALHADDIHKACDRSAEKAIRAL